MFCKTNFCLALKPEVTISIYNTKNYRFVIKELFDFYIINCDNLHFKEDGYLVTKTYAKTFFKILHGKVFGSEAREFNTIAKGSVLHKIKYRYSEFRQY